jgi:hypothetical protein
LSWPGSDPASQQPRGRAAEESFSLADASALDLRLRGDDKLIDLVDYH